VETLNTAQSINQSNINTMGNFLLSWIFQNRMKFGAIVNLHGSTKNHDQVVPFDRPEYYQRR